MSLLQDKLTSEPINRILLFLLLPNIHIYYKLLCTFHFPFSVFIKYFIFFSSHIFTSRFNLLFWRWESFGERILERKLFLVIIHLFYLTELLIIYKNGLTKLNLFRPRQPQKLNILSCNSNLSNQHCLDSSLLTPLASSIYFVRISWAIIHWIIVFLFPFVHCLLAKHLPSSTVN